MKHFQINAYNSKEALEKIKRVEPSLHNVSLGLEEIDFSKEEYPLLSLEKYLRHEFNSDGALIKIREQGYFISKQEANIFSETLDVSEDSLIYIEDLNGNRSEVMSLKFANKYLQNQSSDMTYFLVFNEEHNQIGEVVDNGRLYRIKPKRISKLHRRHGIYNRYFLILKDNGVKN